ncbi:MAG: dihydropteroate synthase [Pseudomonadota bacterium]
MTLAGGWGWFTHAELLRGTGPSEVLEADALPSEALKKLVAPRVPVAGIDLSTPRIMGILNTTPDSFSDGGLHALTGDALRAGQAMEAAGADIVDVGGESTRPGAETVPTEEEIKRVVPVIEGMRRAGLRALISADTRKADVALAAVASGAGLINDVSGFTYDRDLIQVAQAAEVPVCVMHAQGDPTTMQKNPIYNNVLLDVFDFLEEQIAMLEAAGIARHRIFADPGIGFGKTLEHNLALLARVSLFHSLGVPLLIGASRKRFIGTISKAPEARMRMPGSVAVALAALAQGVQVVRAHDVTETAQAIALWRASVTGKQA